MNAQELVLYIFEQKAGNLATLCLHGFQTSPRFKAFAVEYRNKMRRKVRECREADSLASVWCEFVIAWWLLQERRFEVLYEPCLKDRQRGPDFTVRFKSQIVFHIEVTRLRSTRESGLVEIVCGKLSQMPASAINLLVIVMDHALPTAADFDDLVKRADGKDDTYFRLRGFDGSRDFLRHWNRLSGVLVRAEQANAEPSRFYWVNTRATHRLAADLLRILEGLPSPDLGPAKLV